MTHSHQAEDVALLSMAMISAIAYSLWVCRADFFSSWLKSGRFGGLKRFASCSLLVPVSLGLEALVAWTLRHDGSGLLELLGFVVLLLVPVILLVPEIKEISAWQVERNARIRLFSNNPGVFQSLLIYIFMYMFLVGVQYLALG